MNNEKLKEKVILNRKIIVNILESKYL